MKSGYYIYNNEKYRFELDDGYITVTNEIGIDLKKFVDNLNGKYKENNNMQTLKVKLFPNWNDAIIFHNHNLDSIGSVSRFKIFGIKYKEQKINALNVYAKELEHIYDSSRVVDDFKWDKDGNMNLTIKPFEQVISEKKRIKIKKL